MQYFDENFQNTWVVLRGTICWSAHVADLCPSDYFLWTTTPPTNLDYLNIRHCQIYNNLLANIIQAICSRELIVDLKHVFCQMDTNLKNT